MTTKFESKDNLTAAAMEHLRAAQDAAGGLRSAEQWQALADAQSRQWVETVAAGIERLTSAQVRQMKASADERIQDEDEEMPDDGRLLV